LKSVPRQGIRCREIAETDIDAVADLLTRGFVGRSRQYWMQGLRRQAAREVPKGYPRFGYMLDADGVLPAWRESADAAHADYPAWTDTATPKPGDVNLGEIMIWLRDHVPTDTILCNGAVVNKTSDFPAAFAAARQSGQPAIIHLKIDPDAILPAATLSGIRERALQQA
jgi:hypothetical protein